MPELSNEPVHEISNTVVCTTSKASDQPAHTRSLIRAFASRLCILWLLKLLTEHYLEFLRLTGAAQARLSLHLSKCHIVGNHVSRLSYDARHTLYIRPARSTYALYMTRARILIYQSRNGPWSEKVSLIFFENSISAYAGVLDNFFIRRPTHVSWLSNSYTMGCPPVRGDNPRALASGLSYVQVDKHGITILYHLHQCRPCTSSDIPC